MDNKKMLAKFMGVLKNVEAVKSVSAAIIAFSIIHDVPEDEVLNIVNVAIKAELNRFKGNGEYDQLKEVNSLLNALFKKP